MAGVGGVVEEKMETTVLEQQIKNMGVKRQEVFALTFTSIMKLHRLYYGLNVCVLPNSFEAHLPM